jgi:hypothetical protein
MTEPALTIHVERTAADDVLRWVCHRPDLEPTPVPPSGSLLEGLIRDGVIDRVEVQSGDLLIRFVDHDDRRERDILDAVHRAVTDALRDPNWSAPTGLTAVTIRTPQPPGD